MSDSDNWIKDELLQAFYAVVDDYKSGAIEDDLFKERLLRLAERYERRIGKKEMTIEQKDLF
jgi:hypothetical protein